MLGGPRRFFFFFNLTRCLRTSSAKLELQSVRHLTSHHENKKLQTRSNSSTRTWSHGLSTVSTTISVAIPCLVTCKISIVVSYYTSTICWPPSGAFKSCSLEGNDTWRHVQKSPCMRILYRLNPVIITLARPPSRTVCSLRCVGWCSTWIRVTYVLHKPPHDQDLPFTIKPTQISHAFYTPSRNRHNVPSKNSQPQISRHRAMRCYLAPYFWKPPSAHTPISHNIWSYPVVGQRHHNVRQRGHHFP